MQLDERKYFDQMFDEVVAVLPVAARARLDTITVYIEDHPSREVMDSLGIHDPRQLMGLYRGIPNTHRSVHISGVLSDAIYIYREGIMAAAGFGRSRPSDSSLREEIRITILHELGHHFGLDEDELSELGY